MTNEQAIDILTEVKYMDDSMYQYDPIYMEALDMAIEALKMNTDVDFDKVREQFREIDNDK